MGIVGLITSSLKKFMSDLSPDEEEQLVDLVSKLVAMTSSPEFSIKEVEKYVLDFVKGSSREYGRYLR